MVLNRLQYEALRYAVQIVGSNLEMNIYTMNDGRLGNTGALKYGVNWGARGTQNPEDTLAFARNLQEAAQIAQMLTDMEIICIYGNEGPEISDETYHKYVKVISEMIELGLPEETKEFLNKMA